MKCESPIERKLGWRLLRALRGWDVTLRSQYRWQRWRMDFALLGSSGVLLFIECDGRAYHSQPHQLLNDLRKDDAARISGIPLLRFTGRQINSHAAACVHDVMCALEREGAMRSSAYAYTEEFEGWWLAYPRTPVMSKKEAFAQWRKLSDVDRRRAALALPEFVAWLRARPDHPVVHACRFLSQKRWEGFLKADDFGSLFTPPPANRVHVEADTPQWKAWCAYRGRTMPIDRAGGWWVPSEWPPGVTP